MWRNFQSVLIHYWSETAPKGYIVANKVTFEIKDTGDIQGAKMEDEQAMGKVILNKTDKDSKKPMKG